MTEPPSKHAIPDKGLDLGPGRRPVTRGDVDVYEALVRGGSMRLAAPSRSLASRAGRAVAGACTKLCPAALRGRLEAFSRRFAASVRKAQERIAAAAAASGPGGRANRR